MRSVLYTLQRLKEQEKKQRANGESQDNAASSETWFPENASHKVGTTGIETQS